MLIGFDSVHFMQTPLWDLHANQHTSEWQTSPLTERERPSNYFAFRLYCIPKRCFLSLVLAFVLTLTRMRIWKPQLPTLPHTNQALCCVTAELSSLLSRSLTLLSSIRSRWHLGCRGSFPRQLSWAMGRSSVTQFADDLPLQAWPRLVDQCIRYAKCTRGQCVYKPWQCDTEEAAQRELKKTTMKKQNASILGPWTQFPCICCH